LESTDFQVVKDPICVGLESPTVSPKPREPWKLLPHANKLWACTVPVDINTPTDVAIPVPLMLVAVTLHVKVLPASLSDVKYVLAVASGIKIELLYHWYENPVGEFNQVPVDIVRGVPAVRFPEIIGRSVFIGKLDNTVTLVVVADKLPAELDAVTVHVILSPT
jgi:hypothetical protein